MKIRFNARRLLTSVALLAGFMLQAIPGVAAAKMSTPTLHQVDSVISSINPQLSFAVRHHYSLETLAAAKRAQIDPCLLIAIVSVESHWQASAISPHGAIGLGQLEPLTAASLHANPYSPGENLRATSQYLRLLLNQFAGPSENVTAIAAYNAGPGALARNHNIPPNSSNRMYVRRVLGVWAQARNLIAQSTRFFGHHHKAERLPEVPYWGIHTHENSDLS